MSNAINYTAPKTSYAKSVDGVRTGMRITQGDSVGMGLDGKPVNVPAGTLITSPLAGGYDARLGGQYVAFKTAAGVEVAYLVK
jgi:hypothetical protein